VKSVKSVVKSRARSRKGINHGWRITRINVEAMVLRGDGLADGTESNAEG